MKFTDLNLHESLQMGLGDIGYSEPTPIQKLSIPIILNKKDVLGAAQTGTGKTGAFVIPIIQQILEEPSEGTKALILSPTRELAQQIDEQIFALGYHCGISSATIIGGEDFSRQANAIRAGVDIIVATPGRLIDQMKVLDVDFSNIRFLILDEADRMLDMGFMPDVTHIIDKLPNNRQTLLFSATMPNQIQNLAKDIMNDPELIEIELSKPSQSVAQKAYIIDGREKLKLAQHLLDKMEWTSCIIFTATKRGTDQLERLLSKKGINAASIHGDKSQDERTKALNEFKNGEVPIIVATDVLARGIDIADVSLIINYDVPRAVEDYIHRIGRTGRYDKTGVAITLVSKQDTKFFNAIKAKAGKDLEIFEGSESLKNITPDSVSVDKKADKKEKDAKKNSDSDNKADQKPAKPVTPDFKKAGSVKFSNTEDGKISIQLNNKKEEKPKEEKAKKEPVTVVKKKVDVKIKKEPKPKPNVKAKPKAQKKAKAPKKSNKPKVVLKTIDKASERNKNAPKPSKGIWGLIKSFFPRG